MQEPTQDRVVVALPNLTIQECRHDCCRAVLPDASMAQVIGISRGAPPSKFIVDPTASSESFFKAVEQDHAWPGPARATARALPALIRAYRGGNAEVLHLAASIE